jgi:hypothetical protein
MVHQFEGMDKEVQHIVHQFGGMDKEAQHMVHQFEGMDKEVQHILRAFWQEQTTGQLHPCGNQHLLPSYFSPAIKQVV